MTRFLKGTDRPLAEAYQLALLDLDGVVYRGKNPVDTCGRFHSQGRSRRHDHRIHHEQLLALPATWWPTSSRASAWTLEPWQVITSSVVAARMVAKALPAAARKVLCGAEHLRDGSRQAGS